MATKWWTLEGAAEGSDSVEGALARLLAKLARVDTLIVNDFALAPMSELERRDFLDICDDRYRLRSTILTSQLPAEQWHGPVGDATVADSILDRLVHNAHRFELRGESLRKVQGRAEIAAVEGVRHDSEVPLEAPTRIPRGRHRVRPRSRGAGGRSAQALRSRVPGDRPRQRETGPRARRPDPSAGQEP